MIADAWPERLKAVAYLLGAVALVVVAWRARRLVADVRGVKVTMDTDVVDKIANVERHAESNTRQLDEINTAVNRKAPHEPTMVKRLATVERRVVDLNTKFDRFTTDTKAWQNEVLRKIGIDVRAANAEQTSTEGKQP